MAPTRNGYWGDATATIDWCEENYVVTPYIAEFWNTLSNLAMILPSIGGFFYARRANYEVQLLSSFLSLGLVGIGSWFFHMTLLYEMQLFDELPMIWGSLMLVFMMFSVLYPEIIENNTPKKAMLSLALILYGLLCTLVYLTFKTPILFQSAYGALVTLMLYLDIRIIKQMPCDRRLFYASVAFYYGGFVLWLVDNFYCDSLRSLRSSGCLGVFAPITQLHAWWHFMAGYGAYLHILFCASARLLQRGHSNVRVELNPVIGLVLTSDVTKAKST